MNKICVIGGANIDICGASLEPLRNYDSNPGTIEMRYGGVGRNICQILALLKQNVEFVTCFSSDYYGQQLQKDCEGLGMDTSKSVIVNDLPSSMYIAILDQNRDMKIAMSDMRILRRLTHEAIDHALSDLGPDDFLVVDANLSGEDIAYALMKAPCRTAADPVSANKADRMKPMLDHLSVFKPNQYESEQITGIRITNEKTASASLQWFLDHGVKEIIISMADRGILLGTEGRKIWLTHRTILLDNATGGGDSFMGAYLAARLAGKNPDEALRYGATAAVITIEHDAVRRRSLSEEQIQAAVKDMEIKEKNIA